MVACSESWSRRVLLARTPKSRDKRSGGAAGLRKTGLSKIESRTQAERSVVGDVVLVVVVAVAVAVADCDHPATAATFCGYRGTGAYVILWATRAGCAQIAAGHAPICLD